MRFKIERWELDNIINSYKRGWDKALYSMVVEGTPVEEKKEEEFKCLCEGLWSCLQNHTKRKCWSENLGAITSPLPKQKIMEIKTSMSTSQRDLNDSLVETVNIIIKYLNSSL